MQPFKMRDRNRNKIKSFTGLAGLNFCELKFHFGKRWQSDVLSEQQPRWSTRNHGAVACVPSHTILVFPKLVFLRSALAHQELRSVPRPLACDFVFSHLCKSPRPVNY